MSYTRRGGGVEEGAFDSSGFLAEKAVISAFAVPHLRFYDEEREKEGNGFDASDCPHTEHGTLIVSPSG